MRILFQGINYAPEEIGIAVYSTGMCEQLAKHGHSISAVVAKPYYPEWQIREAFRQAGSHRSVENGIDVTRIPLYVPSVPTGLKRILHHLSFASRALLPMIREAKKIRPDIIATAAPSLIAAPVALLVAKLCGAKTWLHLQDFEVGASIATGLIRSNSLTARLANIFEKVILRQFDLVSSISPQMCAKAQEMVRPGIDVFEFRNWAKIDQIVPLERPSHYHKLWEINTPHVALYSGNIANKQGIGIVVAAARLLAHRSDLTFVICGEGPNRKALESKAKGLPNIQFHGLQPGDQLGELMGLATVHLLPQLATAADLVLPSKLTNMLASGRPVVATAKHGTGLAAELEGAAILSKPGDTDSFARAIVTLIDNPELHAKLSSAAREKALENWSFENTFPQLERKLLALAGSGVLDSAAQKLDGELG